MANHANIETKSIYAIINKINNMIYVGQSNNPTLRFQQHVSDAKHRTNSSYIDTSIAAYGPENFEMVILEENVTNYHDREKYWINQMQSRYPNGYNLGEGGATNGTGVNNPTSMIKDQSELNWIVYELINRTDKSMHKIARDHGITDTVIVGINSGAYYHNDQLKYPLRQNRLSDDTFNRLVYSLKYELDKTLVQISEEYGIEISCLHDINNGRSYHKNYLQYPLRSGKVTSPLNDHYMEIIDLLMNSDMSQKEIARKFNVGAVSISNINLGNAYRQPNLTYPLRQREYKQRTSLSPDMLAEIENLLQNTDVSIRDIAKRFEMNSSFVAELNRGHVAQYYDSNRKYPIRKPKRYGH